MKTIGIWLMWSVLVLSGGAHVMGQCCAQNTVSVSIEIPMDCHTPTDASHSETVDCMCDQCHTLISAIWVNAVAPQYRVTDRVYDTSGRYLQVHSAAFHPPRQNV